MLGNTNMFLPCKTPSSCHWAAPAAAAAVSSITMACVFGGSRLKKQPASTCQALLVADDLLCAARRCQVAWGSARHPFWNGASLLAGCRIAQSGHASSPPAIDQWSPRLAVSDRFKGFSERFAIDLFINIVIIIRTGAVGGMFLRAEAGWNEPEADRCSQAWVVFGLMYLKLYMQPPWKKDGCPGQPTLNIDAYIHSVHILQVVAPRKLKGYVEIFTGYKP